MIIWQSESLIYLSPLCKDQAGDAAPREGIIRQPIISWKTSREANAQLKSLMRENGALRPQYPFFLLSIDFVMKISLND